MLCASLSLRASPHHQLQSDCSVLPVRGSPGVAADLHQWMDVFVLLLLRCVGSWPHLKVRYSSQRLGSGNNHVTDFAIACFVGCWSEAMGSEKDSRHWDTAATRTLTLASHKTVIYTPGGKIRIETFFFSVIWLLWSEFHWKRRKLVLQRDRWEFVLWI